MPGVTPLQASDTAREPFAARVPERAQLVLALLATALATGVCYAFEGVMSVAGLALVYLLAVMGIAALLNRAAGVAASLLSVSALNYFFVPPRYSFEVQGAEYWWTLAVLLAVSLGINGLTASVRADRARARLGEARSAQLHALAESLAACTDHRDMARCAAAWLSDQLGRPCAVFIRAEGDQAMPFFAADTQAQFHEQAVRWALEHGRPLGRGCADWPDLPLWCAPFSPRGPRSPAGAVQVLLQRGDRPQGEEIDHWQALVRQVGLSVERERAADAAREAKAQADAQDTRNILLASLAHDLRTPLTGIVGSASALRAQGDAMTPAQRAHLLANLENEARDMALMADNILQMARLSQPHSQLVLQWESIEELLGTAAERMRRRWPGARITWKVPPGLPPVQVEASLMAQLVANLIDNALRHAGAQAEIVIQAGRSRGGIFIAVRDHGPGLPPQLAPADLFKPNAARHRSAAGGAGLGLTICQAIVKAHGGRIAATPCNPGLEFRVDLPVAPALEASHA